MQVDRVRVLKLLEDVKRQADFIERLSLEEIDSFLAHDEKVYSLRYAVIQAVEAMAGVCVHLMAKVYGTSSESYAGCFDTMGEKGVLSKDLASRLAAMARLRNLLVHRYWDIDDARVFRYCREGTKDLRAFIKSVARFLEETR